MKTVSVLLAVLVLSLAPFAFAKDTLDRRILSTLNSAEPHVVGHESVWVESGNKTRYKYLVVDVRYDQPREEPQRQQSVDRICRALLLDQPLLQGLSEKGFQMVAVAFDRQHQYDCL